MANFGKELRAKEFLLDEDYVGLNHGSYGTVPRKILQKRQSLQAEMERNPDNWHRRRNPQLFADSLKAGAALLGTAVQNVVFVENTTTGMVSALRSLKWEAGDCVILTSVTYHAVKKLAEALHLDYGVETIVLEVTFPVENAAQVTQMFEQGLQKNAHKNIKLAIIDHISSPSSILFPVKEVATICRRHNVLVFVDGAHAPGQVDIDVDDLGVDFYAGNIHKWLFAPRGCALMYVSPRHQQTTHHVVTSHFYNTRMQYDFCVRGTQDDSAYHCLPDCLQFQKQLGGLPAITAYVEQTLAEGVRRLCAAWPGARPLAVAPDCLAPFMRLVRLPDMHNYQKTAVGGGELERDLYNMYNIQVLCMLVAGELYLRLSAHVYTAPDDFSRLQDAVLDLMSQPLQEKPKQAYDLPIMHWELDPITKLIDEKE